MAKSGSFGEVDSHVQAVMDLVEKRAVGAASNEDVEAAVQQLLEQEPNDEDEPKKAPFLTTKKSTATTTVVQDTENYDDDDEEEEEQRKPPPKRQRKAKPVDTSLYDDIPLGLQGAQMLTTFGDGRQPHPTTVAAVLTGARLMLHVAIQDARHMRRRNVEWYKQAQQKVTGTMPTTPTKTIPTNSQESTEILYRAIDGRDPLARTEKCGFAITDLQTLFPEEMSAFTRFNEMHAETETVDKSADVTTDDNEEATPQKSVVTIADSANHTDGHLKDRAANFDVRTRKMHEDWYFQYCELRQGSFLPRRCKKKDQPKGLSDDWTGLSFQQVRFLHWIGFDPQSSLPPPSDDTTDALAFLGYDFVGRIVEKAIFFRLLEKRKADTTTIVLELDLGDQLEASDIQKAMDDLRPAPIYASSRDGESRRTQLPGSHPLFFGNGFENRLELEIEEFMLERKLTPEELEIRKEEESLFATIAKAAPPSPKETVLSYKKKQQRKK